CVLQRFGQEKGGNPAPVNTSVTCVDHGAVKNQCSWFIPPTAPKGSCSCSSWSFPAEPSIGVYFPAQMGSS
ncbi:unnamed protein product, partial [Gulo gulo]